MFSDKSDELNFKPGSFKKISVVFENKLPNKISDIIFEIEVPSDFIEKQEIKVEDGFYDSRKNKITWNKNTSELFSDVSAFSKIKTSFFFKN